MVNKLGTFAIKKLSLGVCACILGIGAQLPAFADDWTKLDQGFLPKNIDQGFNAPASGGAGISPPFGTPGQVLSTGSGGNTYQWINSSGSGTVTNVSVASLPTWLSGSFANGSTLPALAIASASALTSHQVLGTFAGTTIALGSLAAADLPSTAVNSVNNLSPLFTASITSQTLGFVLSTFAAHSFYGNNTGTTGTPAAVSIGAADLPSTTVNSTGNLSPLFTSSISGQALSFSQSNFTAHTFYGNNTGSTGAPGAVAIGAGDLPSTAVNAVGSLSPLFTASISSQALGFVLSSFAAHTFYGNNTGTGGSPAAVSIGAGDLPSTTVNSTGNLSPLFTSAISGQALSFSQSAFTAHGFYGNNTGATAAPSVVQPGFPDLSGNIAISQIASGTGATSSTFLRGDNTWATPAGGGGGGGLSNGGAQTTSFSAAISTYYQITGTATCTLPTAAGNGGMQIGVQVQSGGTVTFATTSGQVIVSASNYASGTLVDPNVGDTWWFISDGTNWDLSALTVGI